VAALDNLPRSRTTLIIGHRQSMVRRADRIVMLEGGAIVEQGKHDELMRRGGPYSRLQSQPLPGSSRHLAELPLSTPVPAATVTALVAAPR